MMKYELEYQDSIAKFNVEYQFPLGAKRDYLENKITKRCYKSFVNFVPIFDNIVSSGTSLSVNDLVKLMK